MSIEAAAGGGAGFFLGGRATCSHTVSYSMGEIRSNGVRDCLEYFLLLFLLSLLRLIFSLDEHIHIFNLHFFQPFYSHILNKILVFSVFVISVCLSLFLCLSRDHNILHVQRQLLAAERRSSPGANLLVEGVDHISLSFCQ